MSFQTKTENEYLRRTHVMTLGVLAGAIIALVLVSGMFAGTMCYMFSRITSLEYSETITQTQDGINNTQNATGSR